MTHYWPSQWQSHVLYVHCAMAPSPMLNRLLLCKGSTIKIVTQLDIARLGVAIWANVQMEGVTI